MLIAFICKLSLISYKTESEYSVDE